MSTPSEPRPEVFHLDPKTALPRLTGFIREEVARAGRKRVVLGMSGGVDSSLVAHLAVQALGIDHVRAYLLPFRTSSRDSQLHARLEAEKLGIPHETMDITAMAEALFHQLPNMDRRRMGNVMARLRMIVLYDRSEEHQALVIGTSNRTEIMLGYGTLHGDAAWGLNPIGDLYKTQVVDLATFYRLPARLVSKRPSAGLFPGQTDEKDLGMSYTRLDKVLYGLELQMSFEDISKKTGEDVETVSRVAALLNRSQHKRAGFIIPKIGHRTVGLDWRAPPSRAL